MDIISVKYVSLNGEIHSIKIILDGETIFAPLDPANRHYAEIMRQVEAGELVIQPAE